MTGHTRAQISVSAVKAVRTSVVAFAVAALTITAVPIEAGAATKAKNFSNPKIGGRWLDICYAHGACRQQKAADTYCRMQGYDKAGSFSSRKSKFGHKNARIGDNSTCLSTVGNCHRFTKVRCLKTIAAPNPRPDKDRDLGRDLAIGAIGTIIGGIAAGAAQGQQPPPPPPPDSSAGGLSPEHVDWCYSKYRSYKATTNTYMAMTASRITATRLTNRSGVESGDRAAISPGLCRSRPSADR